MFHSKTWDSVPPGSTLSVAIDPQSGPFAIVGRHTIEGNNQPVVGGNFGTGQFPLTIRLHEGANNFVRFEVASVGPSTAFAVDARVFTPGGGEHQTKLLFQENLSSANPITVKLFLVSA